VATISGWTWRRAGGKLLGEVGETVTLNNVLLVASGRIYGRTALVAGSAGYRQILRQAKLKNSGIQKKRRKNYRRLAGIVNLILLCRLKKFNYNKYSKKYVFVSFLESQFLE
jgi:ribosomal protein L21